jgi:hypothetical protein
MEMWRACGARRGVWCCGTTHRFLSRVLLGMVLFLGTAGSEGSAGTQGHLAAEQRADVKEKMAADEAAVNANSLGKMLQAGFSIPAILASITKHHGIGACCTAALAVGGSTGTKTIQTMLREDPGEYSSDNGGVEGTVKLLASRAGTCCRGSLCTSLHSDKQCGWLGTCTWHTAKHIGGGLCKEMTTNELLEEPQGKSTLERTQNFVALQLRKKEQELKQSDIQLAQEEEELSAEREISRLTHEAQSLFKKGKYSEAKLYLEEAVRLDSSTTVKHIPGTSSNPSDRQGLHDLRTAADILDALGSKHHTHSLFLPPPPQPSSTSQVLSGIGGPVTYGATLGSSAAHGHGVYTTKTLVRLMGLFCVCLIAYITVGFRCVCMCVCVYVRERERERVSV